MTRLVEYDLWVVVQTPVHVGTGSVLRRDADYVVEPSTSGKQVRLIDVDRALELISDDELARLQGGFVARALGDRTRQSVTRAIFTYHSQADPPEIREHITLQDGTPYIPGSSLKGAVRTALLTHLAAASPPTRLDGQTVEVLAGARGELPNAPAPANRDLLRLVRISDLVREVSRGSQLLVEARARALRPGAHQQTRGIPIWLLALAPGTRLRGSLTVESGSLLSRAVDESQRTALNRLLTETLAEFAVGLARYEQGSYHEAGSAAPALFADIEKDNGRTSTGVWCNLGWGGGWHAKTIASALSDHQWETAVQQVRRRFRQSGPAPRPFPASRRIALTQRGEEPMGWVQVGFARRHDSGAA